MTTVVISERGRYIWARGAHRVEIARVNSNSWRWRVWHVLGPVTIGSAIVSTKGRATIEAFKCLDGETS